jgi:para-nitrobenzyl esterase
MMFGSNSREGGGQRPGAAPPSREEVLAATKERISAFYAAYPDLQQRAMKAYGFSGPEDNLSINPRYFGPEFQFGTDTFMRCETVAIAGWHSAVAPTFEYEFTAGNDAHPPVHSAELDFVFGYLRDQAADKSLGNLSEQMQQYWTNFAKTGNPNGPGLPKWSKYDVKTRGYMELSNEGPVAKSDIQSAPCAIYVEKLNRDIDARMK